MELKDWFNLMVPTKAGVERIARQLAADRERARMDFLSDSDNQFGYSIRANGQCIVRTPWPLVAKDLRAAIDWQIEKNRQQGQPLRRAA